MEGVRRPGFAFRALRPILISVLAAAALTASAPYPGTGAEGWNTTTAVVPGGTLTINETVPNVVIATSTPIATCPITGLGTDFITYTCDPAGPGILAGTAMSQAWSDPRGNTLSGPFSETVTYNATRPLAGPSPTTQTIFGSNPPLLTSIDPASGPPGATITLTGTNLRAFALSFGGSPGRSTQIGPSGGTTVNLGMVPAGNVRCNDAGTSCTASVGGSGPGSVAEITVTTSAGTSNTLDFTYTAAPAPSPTPGP